jgi:hypothetical protein
MAIKSQAQLTTDIQTRLADNNAGLISAADVRENIQNTVDSINYIVASGDFDATHPFSGSNVRAKRKTIGQNQFEFGIFIAESGIEFANAGGANRLQLIPYPGPSGIQHNELSGLNTGNPHKQYLHINGFNIATNNLPMGDAWINSSGNASTLVTNNRGIKFTYVNNTKELMNVGNQTTVKFDIDSSTMYSAKGAAQAWLRFEGTSGNIIVNSSYNISSIQHINNGNYKIFFAPNTFTDANYVAIGHSNAIAASGSAEDFDVNTVGIVDRNRNYLTFLVKSDDNEYVNARVNDLVVFGNASGVIPSSGVTIVNLPT